jgi:hypothetical protein
MIKKVFLYGIAVLGVAAVATWNVSLNSQKSNKLSDTMLANVEALAGEGDNTKCSTVVRYEFRQELCGSGNQKTSLSIRRYSCTTGNFSQCQSGCIITGSDCYGYVNTNCVESRSC